MITITVQSLIETLMPIAIMEMGILYAFALGVWYLSRWNEMHEEKCQKCKFNVRNFWVKK
jgi:hypothetical protein